MKSIERRFKSISEENPMWSSYVCFVRAIRGGGFSKQIVARWFHKLVSREDYAREDKKEVLADLVKLSNILEDDPK